MKSLVYTEGGTTRLVLAAENPAEEAALETLIKTSNNGTVRVSAKRDNIMPVIGKRDWSTPKDVVLTPYNE